MSPLRFSSFFLSLCLHAGIAAAVLFWPGTSSRPPVDLDAPTFDFDIYTIGKEGSLAPGDPIPQIDKPQSPDFVPDQPAQTPEAPAAPEAAPDTTKPEPVPVKPEPKPEPQPEAVPVPAPDVVEQKPEPKPEPKKPDPKPEPKPEKTTTKPEPKKTEAPKPRRPKESADDILRKALGDLGKSSGKGSVSKALGDLQNSVGTSATPGPGGSGGDGIGLVGSYMQSLVSRIRPNWEYQGRADRKNPRAVVTITIAKDGTITDAKITRSSGDTAFDGSVLKAIRDTERVEAPPTAELQKINVPFAYRALRQGR